MKTKGFTLIELTVSILILSMLGLYTWLSIGAAIRSQKTMERFANLHEVGSATLGKLTMDLSQSFVIPSSQNLTYLIGKESEISFTSLSHGAFQENHKESEATEISYKTESNPDRSGALLLLRNETRYIDGPKEKKEDDKFEPLTGLLESITFEYSKDGVDFKKQWDTTNRDQKDTLPKMIKLSLKLKDVPLNEFNAGQNDRKAKEVFFQTFIDIPMSEFFSPAPVKGDGKNNGQSPNNQPSQSGGTAQPNSAIQPFGVNG